MDDSITNGLKNMCGKERLMTLARTQYVRLKQLHTTTEHLQSERTSTQTDRHSRTRITGIDDH